MNIDIVNAKNEKVGSLEVDDTVFGGRVRSSLIWESVVHQNAGERRGTHATKNRALVSGSGRKPWRQKGTGRARVGEIRNPLWRKGGTVFGPQPRDYSYTLPRRVERGALRAALADRLQRGSVVIIDQLTIEEGKSKAAAELLRRLGADGKTLLVDVEPDETFARATRNLARVSMVSSGRITARDLMNASRVIVTQRAMEQLQATLGKTR
jgi:large subunit ribosomal protein L4